MSATTAPAAVSGVSAHTQQLNSKDQTSGATRSSRKREKTHSANGHNQMETDLPAQSETSEAKKAKTATPASPGAVKPSIHDIYKTLEYGPAPEASNVVEAWLDDHKRYTEYFKLYFDYLVSCTDHSDTLSMENGTCRKGSATLTRVGTR